MKAILALVLTSVLSATGAYADDLAEAVVGCAKVAGDPAQLACFRGIAERLKSGHPVSTEAQPPTQATGNAPASSAASRDFARDTLPFQPQADEAPQQVIAKVTTVSYNYFHHFTVTLENGQVWRQLDADTKVAHFDGDRPTVVTIKRGFLDSFHLSAEGVWGNFEVKRIK